MYVTGKVEVKKVLKLTAGNWSGFNLGEVESAGMEPAKHAVQRAGNVGQVEAQADFIRLLGDIELL